MFFRPMAVVINVTGMLQFRKCFRVDELMPGSGAGRDSAFFPEPAVSLRVPVSLCPQTEQRTTAWVARPFLSWLRVRMHLS